MLTLQAQDHPQLFDFAEFLGSSCARAWLVGGTVRDLLLGEQPADYDIAFCGDLSPEIRSWSRLRQGCWFWLDQERNQSRVLLEGGRLQFDFAPLRADTILGDLRLRDFTLNAIALPMQQLTAGALIDPLGGVADLQSGNLRSCSADVLISDPLRCLKGIRHHAQRGWEFTPETLGQIRATATLLNRVAGERLRTELSRILTAPHLTSAIRLLAETGLDRELFPGFNESQFRVAIRQARKRLDTLAAFEPIRVQLEAECESLLPLQSLLILALIFSCTTTFNPESVERLRLSRRSSRLLDLLVNSEPARIDLKADDSPRISALKLEQLGAEPVARLLFTLLQGQGAEPLSLYAAALARYDAQLRCGRVPDLLGGDILIGQCPTLSGKEIGVWLGKIKEAEINGEISCDSEAEAWLKRQFSN